MKTLDEVIEGIRDQIGLGDPVLIDALHYLKEYRSILVQAAERCHKRVMDEFINGSQGEKK